MRNRNHEIDALRRELRQMRREIGAKQFAIELLTQESLCCKAQQLMSSEVFRKNACLFRSPRAREDVPTEASSSGEVMESKS